MVGWKRAAWQTNWTNRGFTAPPPLVHGGGWSTFEIAALVVAFVARWELGLAFLALKLWQQASHHQGSVFSFARLKWDGLVEATRGLASGQPAGTSIEPRSSQVEAFDGQTFERWRAAELARVEVECDTLRAAAADAIAYREDLSSVRGFDEWQQLSRSRRKSHVAQ